MICDRAVKNRLILYTWHKISNAEKELEKSFSFTLKG